ncbi:MAG: S-adenosyl-l-methionine hydroxide adenosyltransferase family protein [Candidatus Thermoplasmatota archaeon]|nr:S-adenosyl-l-methionine hydroxide adenosyltransferase family protein [Candidatus Thermoplasmatota archaeon]
MRRITFLSDFGTKDGYVAQMKGVASSITEARLLDITHEVAPHNVREGAFILWATAPFFPLGTVHVAVVDPGVGTQRKGLVITTKKQILVGPDNGILLPTAHLLGDFVVYEITNPKYMIHPLSRTFHGRDIFAPVAAYIARGVPFREIGTPTEHYVDLQFHLGENQGDQIVGKVIYTDRFGNLITTIPRDILPKDVEQKRITVVSGTKQWENVSFVSSYGFAKQGDMLITVGSNHFVEISVNKGNAADTLGLAEDAELTLQFS